MKEKWLDPVASDVWFCSRGCKEIHSGLHSRIGLINHIGDGYSWTLLRCIHDDQKVHSAQKFALKAECNTKLVVALSIMEECFASMVDPRTGIDMIPHILYNWGLYGETVAEMPLIATCSKYRCRGMCRRLMTALEELLISLRVEKLLIAAIPELVETWTKSFGFQVVEKDEKQSLNGINLTVFPGTILLKKTLFQGQKSNTQTGYEGQDRILPLGVESKSEIEQLTESYYAKEADPMMGVKLVEANSTEKALDHFAIEANFNSGN
ncbi:hypothetical protein SAY86_016483 [Trapa natans]|uniref:Increased DNA methylation 1 C-terminal domain-containing protein n=1 Tax=Trapa natans TaxID=22666 RepID=A0AAN7LAF6_TRANT|nr:hypothetical protein SAY86_016483 [Trapa natans]